MLFMQIISLVLPEAFSHSWPLGEQRGMNMKELTEVLGQL